MTNFEGSAIEALWSAVRNSTFMIRYSTFRDEVRSLGQGGVELMRKGSGDLDPDGVPTNLDGVAADPRRRMAHAVPGPEIELPRVA